MGSDVFFLTFVCINVLLHIENGSVQAPRAKVKKRLHIVFCRDLRRLERS